MRRWRGVRVLVTGGAGFVGANLVRDLVSREASVHCLVRASTDPWRLQGIDCSIASIDVDLCDREGVTEAVAAVRPRVVYHVAAEGGHPSTPADRLAAVQGTVAATANLLEALREKPCDVLVHCGSMTEYGPHERPVREADVPSPSLYRGALKAASTLLVGQYAQESGHPAITVRLPAVFGPWEQPDRLVPTVATSLLRDREIDLTGGQVSRDYTFVEDVVDGLREAADLERSAAVAQRGGILNLGTGTQVSNHRVVELMEQISGRTLRKNLGAYGVRPVDRALPAIDASLAAELLSWRPRHTLRAGLERTLDWFQEHVDLYPG